MGIVRVGDSYILSIACKVDGVPMWIFHSFTLLLFLTRILRRRISRIKSWNPVFYVSHRNAMPVKLQSLITVRGAVVVGDIISRMLPFYIFSFYFIRFLIQHFACQCIFFPLPDIAPFLLIKLFNIIFLIFINYIDYY